MYAQLIRIPICVLLATCVTLSAYSALAEEQFKVKDGRVSLNFDWQMVGNQRRPLDPALKKTYQTELEQELADDIEILKKQLSDQVILSAVESGNTTNKEVSLSEILERNAKWKKATHDDELIMSLTDAKCNEFLRQFKQSNTVFAEIFVTDKRGLNICQTNKTTDYYQADETWWEQAYYKSQGAPSHGKLEYDQSAAVFAISVYVPIIDKDTREIIGVTKGVVKRKFGSEQS